MKKVVENLDTVEPNARPLGCIKSGHVEPESRTVQEGGRETNLSAKLLQRAARDFR